jgi:hypothetical protein
MENRPPDETFQIRCPRLGHQIYFSYCRAENRGQPCFKVLDCWSGHFLVEDYLKKELPPEQWERVSDGKPKPKMLSLVELIEQAKKRKKEMEK